MYEAEIVIPREERRVFLWKIVASTSDVSRVSRDRSVLPVFIESVLTSEKSARLEISREINNWRHKWRQHACLFLRSLAMIYSRWSTSTRAFDLRVHDNAQMESDVCVYRSDTICKRVRSDKNGRALERKPEAAI